MTPESLRCPAAAVSLTVSLVSAKRAVHSPGPRRSSARAGFGVEVEVKKVESEQEQIMEHRGKGVSKVSKVVVERTAHELLPHPSVLERDELRAEALPNELVDGLLAEGDDHVLGLGRDLGLEGGPLVFAGAADGLLVELGLGLARTERPALSTGGGLVGDEGEHSECDACQTKAGGKCGGDVVVGGKGR